MITVVSFLAQLDGLNPLGPMPPVTKTTGLVFRDIVLIGAAVLALSVVLLFWARRYVRHGRRHRHEHRDSALPDERPPTHHHRHRHRHHRRHHSQPAGGRNPTLAETGGLPPVRSQSSPNPPV